MQIGDVASVSWIETDERPRNVLRRDLDRVLELRR
jgi:hypothetical protein